ncbi:uncharacterized protein LOC144452671 [Glandiceps talaboti]
MAPNSSKPQSPDQLNYLHDAVRRFCKGATTGFTIYTVITILKALAQRRLINSPGAVFKDALSSDNLRFSLFLGSYPAVYKLALHFIQKKRKLRARTDYVIAAVIASLTCLIENADRRKTIAVFLLSRAIGAVYNSIMKRKKITPITYDVSLVFSAATAVVIYGVTKEPAILPKGYYSAIKVWSRDYTEDVLETLYRIPGDKHIPCDPILHPGESCIGHGIRELFVGWLPSSKVYIPIHLIPLIFKYKAFLASPKEEILSFFIKMIRSTTFLVVTGTTMRTTMCILRNYVQPLPPPVPAYMALLCGFIGAFAGIQFEPVHRQGELTMYVAPMSLNALYILGYNRGIFPNVPFGSTIVFMVAMAAIMYLYERDAESLSRMIKSGLAYLCGKPETDKFDKPLGDEKDKKL